MSQENFESLFEALKNHAEGDYAPFHMPGHKRNPQFGQLLGIEDVDVTELSGFDDLHSASGVLKRVNDRAAKIYGVRASRMLVGGSTAGILAAVRALTSRGDGILVARNCHRSVYNAAELCGLDAHYVLPQWLPEGFWGSLDPKTVERALDENANVKVAVVTSPTYEGVISDISGIAAVCRKRGVKLLVDEAHGAHLGFDGFEKSARELGADVVVNSLHKTLPALTQTAVLHVCSGAVDVAEVDEQLAVFESSSPSYPLMASVEGCVGYLESGEIANFAKNVRALRERLAGLKSFSLYGGEGSFKYDGSKLVLISHCRVGGAELMETLRERYKIELEMAGINYAVAMCGAGDSPRMYDRLTDALAELDLENMHQKETLFENSSPNFAQIGNTFCENGGRGKFLHTLRNVGEGAQSASGALRAPKLPKKIYGPSEARERRFEFADISAATGRVCAENICAYPPGSPIVVKGEFLDEETAATLLRLHESGVEIKCAKGRFPQNIAVLA